MFETWYQCLTENEPRQKVRARETGNALLHQSGLDAATMRPSRKGWGFAMHVSPKADPILACIPWVLVEAQLPEVSSQGGVFSRWLLALV
jgi:hypothetical protein